MILPFWASAEDNDLFSLWPWGIRDKDPVLGNMLTQTNEADGCSQQANTQHIVSSCLDWNFLCSVLTQILISTLCSRGTSADADTNLQVATTSPGNAVGSYGAGLTVSRHTFLMGVRGCQTVLRNCWSHYNVLEAIRTNMGFQITLFWWRIWDMWFIMKSSNTLMAQPCSFWSYWYIFSPREKRWLTI